jgi:hypothetical protein
MQQELAPDDVPDRINLNADSDAGANPCITSGETGDDVNSPAVLVQKRVGGDAGESNAKKDADCVGEKGSPTVVQFCTTSVGKRTRLTGADRVQHENVLVMVETAHGLNTDDAWVEEKVERGRSWRPKSPAPVQPCDQVHQECVLDVATGRPGLQAKTDNGRVSGDLSGENGASGESTNAGSQKRMGGDAKVSVTKQSAQEVGQRASFSAEQWCTASTGKRRRLAGADHGKSCTELVPPGNGGFDVPSNSLADANRQGQKRSRADELTVSEAGAAMRSVVHAAANAEGFLSNADEKEPGSVERQGNAGRGKPTVHQRLGGHGGGRGKNVRSGIGENRIAGVTEQSQGSPRPQKSKDMDGEHHEPNRSSPKKARGGSKTARSNSRTKRANNLKKVSKRILAAAQDGGRTAALSAKPAAVPMAQNEVDTRGVNVGDQVLHQGVDGTDQPNRGLGSVTTFRQSTLALSGGSDLSPLRIIQRTAFADAMRRSALLAMVTARAESSGRRLNPAQTQNSTSNLPYKYDGPTPDE